MDGIRTYHVVAGDELGLLASATGVLAVSDRHVCPVCGYGELCEPPWDNESPSDEICPSCGTQFGYHDAAGGDVARRQSKHRELRKRWVARGMPWDSAGIEPPPDGWDPRRQLATVEE